MEKCSLVLGNFGESEKANHVLVNKQVDGVAMKEPVLTGESIALKECFSDKMLLLTNNNTVSITENIIKFSLYKSEIVLEMVEKSFQIYKQYFSPNAFENNLKKLIVC